MVCTLTTAMPNWLGTICHSYAKNVIRTGLRYPVRSITIQSPEGFNLFFEVAFLHVSDLGYAQGVGTPLEE